MKTENIYEQISVKINPPEQAFYNTDKGFLYWFLPEKKWSCRIDRLSEEYPTFWYKKVPTPPPSKEVKSAEEILDIETMLKSVTRTARNDISIFNTKSYVLVEDAIDIAKAYAQQFQSTPISNKEQVIKFAEWIAKDGWVMDGARMQNDSVWTKLQPHNNDITLFGTELYERFLTELNALKS